MKSHRQVLGETLVEDPLLIRVDMSPGHAPDLAVCLDEIREAVVGKLRDDEAGHAVQGLLGIERACQRLTELGQEALVRLHSLRVVDIGRGAEPFDDFPAASRTGAERLRNQRYVPSAARSRSSL